MSDAINCIAATREEAHTAVTHAYALARSIIDNGGRAHIQAGEDQEPISIKQRAFFHAAVLPQIAEQAVIGGTRYTVDIWKEFYRKRFLPDKWEMRKSIRWDAELCKLVQSKRATPHRVRVSTESLGIKSYSAHIDRVIDCAVLELGVAFVFRPSEREAVRYVAKPRAKAAALREEVAA